jgi:hypothetical protein
VGAGWHVIENGYAGNAFFSNLTNSGGITSNAVLGAAGWTYAANGFANFLDVGSAGGQFVWNTAPSGTSGAAVSFTQAMTLDNSGHLDTVGPIRASHGYTVSTLPPAPSAITPM